MNIASSGSGARRGPQFKGGSIELFSVSTTAKSNAMLSPFDPFDCEPDPFGSNTAINMVYEATEVR
jgi:hypothetical protein